MKRLQASGAVLVLVSAGLALGACAPETRAEEAVDPISQQFVGNWELVSYVTIAENGEVTDMNYVGRIMYDALGNMSAVGMPRDLPQRPRVAGEPTPRAGFAYFSTYTVEPEAGRVIHHVIGSPMNPAWVGTDLIRYYEFSGDRLALSLKNDAGRVTGTLTWRRFQ